jgi:hypothetical protein
MKNKVVVCILLIIISLMGCKKESSKTVKDPPVVTLMDTLGNDPFIPGDNYPTSYSLDVDKDSIADLQFNLSSIYSGHTGYSAGINVTSVNGSVIAYKTMYDTTWSQVFVYPSGYTIKYYYNAFDMAWGFQNLDTIHEIRNFTNKFLRISEYYQPGSLVPPTSAVHRTAFGRFGYIIVRTPKCYVWIKLEISGVSYLVVHKYCYGLPSKFVILDL